MKTLVLSIFLTILTALLALEITKPIRLKKSVEVAKSIQRGEKVNPQLVLIAWRTINRELNSVFAKMIGGDKLSEDESKCVYVLSMAVSTLRPIAELAEYNAKKRWCK